MEERPSERGTQRPRAEQWGARGLLRCTAGGTERRGWRCSHGCDPCFDVFAEEVEQVLGRTGYGVYRAGPVWAYTVECCAGAVLGARRALRSMWMSGSGGGRVKPALRNCPAHSRAQHAELRRDSSTVGVVEERTPHTKSVLSASRSISPRGHGQVQERMQPGDARGSRRFRSSGNLRGGERLTTSGSIYNGRRDHGWLGYGRRASF